MGLNEYPICDTDIFYKLCKCKKDSQLFEIYKKINFADVVYQEIANNSGNNSKKDSVEKVYFKKTLKELNKRIKDKLANIINYFQQDLEKKRLIDKYLLKENIMYDYEKRQYILQKDIGEKVSIIYAAVLGIKIILSDDNGSKDFVKKFLRVNVEDLMKVLKKIGLTESEMIQYKFIANYKDSQYAIDTIEYYEKNGKVKGFFDSKLILDYKKTYKHKYDKILK